MTSCGSLPSPTAWGRLNGMTCLAQRRDTSRRSSGILLDPGGASSTRALRSGVTRVAPALRSDENTAASEVVFTQCRVDSLQTYLAARGLSKFSRPSGRATDPRWTRIVTVRSGVDRNDDSDKTLFGCRRRLHKRPQGTDRRARGIPTLKRGCQLFRLSCADTSGEALRFADQSVTT